MSGLAREVARGASSGRTTARVTESERSGSECPPDRPAIVIRGRCTFSWRRNMTKAKSYLPEGVRSVTPHLVVKNALESIEFYKKAFGAELVGHAPGPAPRSTMHASIKIGD